MKDRGSDHVTRFGGLGELRQLERRHHQHQAKHHEWFSSALHFPWLYYGQLPVAKSVSEYLEGMEILGVKEISHLHEKFVSHSRQPLTLC